MTSGQGQSGLILAVAVFAAVGTILLSNDSQATDNNDSQATDNKGLWEVYEQALKGAKYVDLTHTITPTSPVWAGFGDSTFSPAKAGADIEGFVKKGEVYTYAKHGF